MKIPVADGEIPAYRAMPAKGKDFPVVLVVQEIFGVHEHIKDVCRRFAKRGLPAPSRPSSMRARATSRRSTDWKQIFAEVVSKVPDAQVMSDLDAAVAWARQVEQGRRRKLAITGFCWGGRITWLYAAHNPDLKAGVAWYGRLKGQATELQPKYPFDVVADINAPVLGLYGGKDQGIPLDDVEAMRAALKAAGKPSEIVVFPEAGHAFFADYRPSYQRGRCGSGLGGVPCLVPPARRRLKRRQNFQSTPTDGTSGSQWRSSRSSVGVPSIDASIRDRCSRGCAGRARW